MQGLMHRSSCPQQEVTFDHKDLITLMHESERSERYKVRPRMRPRMRHKTPCATSYETSYETCDLVTTAVGKVTSYGHCPYAHC